jgi:hypothetical protein
VKEAQDPVDKAETWLKTVNTTLKGIAGGGLQVLDINYWNTQKTLANEDLAAF